MAKLSTMLPEILEEIKEEPLESELSNRDTNMPKLDFLKSK